MSQLSRQLQDFRAEHSVVPATDRVSFLFDKRDILSLDPEQLVILGQAGLAGLVSADPELAKFSCLFEAKQKARDFMSPSEVSNLDSLIRQFLTFSGHAFLTKDCQACIEFLIQVHQAHIYNSETLVLACLPFHDSPEFGRLAQVLPEFTRNDKIVMAKWSFLETARKTGTVVKRSTITKACKRNAALTQTLLDFAAEAALISESSPSARFLPLNTFMTCLLMEIISDLKSLNFDITFALLPLLHRCFIAGSQPSFFYLGATVLAELQLVAQKSDKLALLRRLAVRAAPSESLAAVVASLATTVADNVVLKALRRRGDGWVDELSRSCGDAELARRVIRVLGANMSHVVEKIEAEISRSGPVPMEVTTAYEEVAEESSSSDEDDAVPVQVIKKVNKPRIEPGQEIEALVAQHFPSREDPLYQSTWSFISAILVAPVASCAAAVAAAAGAVATDAESLSLITLLLRSCPAPADAPLRFLALRTSQVSRSFRKRVLSKVLEEWLFAQIILPSPLAVASLVEAAQPSDRGEVARLLRLYSHEEFKPLGNAAAIVAGILANPTEPATWKFLHALISLKLVSIDGILPAAVAALERLSPAIDLGEAAELCCVLFAHCPRAALLPLFKRAASALLTSLESSAVVSGGSGGAELLVAGKLCRALSALVNRLGEFFADEAMLARLRNIVASEIFDEEEELQALRKTLGVVMLKIPVDLSLDCIRTGLEISTAATEKLLLVMSDFMTACTAALPIEPLGRLILENLLPLATATAAESARPADWSSVENWGSPAWLSCAVVSCISAFSLRLNLAQLDSFFKKLISRKNSLVTLRVFSMIGEGAAVVALLPLMMPEILAALAMRDATGKKKRRSGATADPIRSAGLLAATAALAAPEVPEDTLNELADAAAALVGVEADDEVSRLLVSIGGKSSDAQRKSLASSVLRHGRNASAGVRTAAARVSAVLWRELGEAMTCAASETLVLAVELEDDADEEVAAAARSLVRQVEEVTGESIQDRMA